MQKRIGAVITGGDFQALGALRTLARKNIPIFLLDSDHCISRFSRYKKKFFRSPHPSMEDYYLDFLISLARKEKIFGWIIFPNSDEVVYILSKHKDTLEEFFRIPTPHWGVIKNIHDKKRTYQFAEQHKIPIPNTYYPNNLEDLLKYNLKFPVVIKPSIRCNFFNKVKAKAFLINNEEELVKKYTFACSIIDSSEILIQEYIAGGPHNLYSFCPFFKNGKVITSIMARRARQHPMDFGHASTFVELVNIPEIQKISEKFLSLVGYYGIAEVEFMQDSQDGTYKLLEVNPRLWGWHTLAIAAGVDFPYLLYQDMIGEKIEIHPSLKNIKWIRLITDIPTVFLEIAKGNMKMKDYITSLRDKIEFSTFSFDDLLPFLAEILMIPYLFGKRGF